MYKNKRSGAIGTVIAVIVLILLVILTNLNRDNLSYAESFVTSIIMPVQNAGAAVVSRGRPLTLAIRLCTCYFVQLRIAKVKRGQRFQRFSTLYCRFD